MSLPITALGEKVWKLPPLILHPFNERVPPSALLENSKAALMLSGLIPGDGSDQKELKRRLLAGRYSEIRMLYFLGKDVFRWIEQCVEWGQRVPELSGSDIQPQSFAALLTTDPPEAVKEKLVRWGVMDYGSIFTRAIGLNAMFIQPPVFDALAEEFLRNYNCYADSLYRCYMDSRPYGTVASASFHFILYASGEYSRLLETEWAADGE
jgi:hypothetical protein